MRKSIKFMVVLIPLLLAAHPAAWAKWVWVGNSHRSSRLHYKVFASDSDVRQSGRCKRVVAKYVFRPDWQSRWGPVAVRMYISRQCCSSNTFQSLGYVLYDARHRVLRRHVSQGPMMPVRVGTISSALQRVVCRPGFGRSVTAGRCPRLAGKIVSGYRERVRIGPGRLVFQAHIDTGATTTSLKVNSLQTFRRGHKLWARFKIRDDNGRSLSLVRPVVHVVRTRTIDGRVYREMQVKLRVCLGGVCRPILVGLTPGSGARTLVGRNFLWGRFLVDPGARFILRRITRIGPVDRRLFLDQRTGVVPTSSAPDIRPVAWSPGVGPSVLIGRCPTVRGKMVAGLRERVVLSAGRVALRAFLDTGATTSTLFTPRLTVFRRGGRSWARFTVVGAGGRRIEISRPVVRLGHFRTGYGRVFRKPVVRLRLCLGRACRTGEVSLDRHRYALQKKHRVNLGRNFMAGLLVVDVAAEYTQRPSAPVGRGK